MDVGALLGALLLCILLIGPLVFIHTLLVKPEGTLTVTYTRNEAVAAPAPVVSPALEQGSVRGRLAQLDAPRGVGVITDEWYAAKRSKILDEVKEGSMTEARWGKCPEVGPAGERCSLQHGHRGPHQPAPTPPMTSVSATGNVPFGVALRTYWGKNLEEATAQFQRAPEGFREVAEDREGGAVGGPAPSRRTAPGRPVRFPSSDVSGAPGAEPGAGLSGQGAGCLIRTRSSSGLPVAAAKQGQGALHRRAVELGTFLIDVQGVEARIH
jgi:hypothetical protein